MKSLPRWSCGASIFQRTGAARKRALCAAGRFVDNAGARPTVAAAAHAVAATALSA
jgi:hypothetical protein